MDPYERLQAINEEIIRLKEDVQLEGFKEPKKVNYKGGTALPSTMAKGREPVVISTPRGYIVQTYNKKRDIFSQEGPAYKTKAAAEKAAMKLESVQLDEMKKSNGPFTVVATKNNKVVGQVHSVGHHEIEDAIQSMKADYKGAKVSVESKRGRIVHTEEVNESLMGRIKRYLTTPKAVRQFERAVADLDRKYSNLPENQPKPKPKRKNNRAVANFERMVADLDRKYSNQNESTEAERIDQEFGAAKKALKDAGIEHDSLQAIGSLDREKNTFKIAQKDMRRAREVLKNFPNAQIKRA